MKKTISWILALTLCLGLLAGCGGQNSAGSRDNPAAEATGTVAATESPTQFSITVADPGPIPEVASEKNVTPEEFADILLVENKAPFTSQYME